MALHVELKTLTPIWTGGVETGKMDRIHETGIIGSMRWWYEVIVRGLGGEVCDPTTHSCAYDQEKPNNGLCDVCKIFGATGWQRRFRLIIHETQMQPQSVTHPMKANRLYQNRQGKNIAPTWYFPNSPQGGKFLIEVKSLSPMFSGELVQGLIQLAIDWTALGSRTQMGFGVTELISKRLITNPFNHLRLAGSGSSNNLPSLQNMFFTLIQKKNITDQETFNLKYDLRRLFADNKDVRHFVMGTVQGDRIAAKIHMSRPYANGVIRVWGWVPVEADVWNDKWNRDGVLTKIKNYLASNYALITWREFNNARDLNHQYPDIREFLYSLWEGKK